VKTGDGIDPVSLVHTICKDAHSKSDQKRSRFIKRMTPMTLMRKTMGGGLEHVSQSVLRPHFHAGGPAKKVSKEWGPLPPSISAILGDKLGRFCLDLH
jgi:tRNA acetyltransferase TAN1